MFHLRKSAAKKITLRPLGVSGRYDKIGPGEVLRCHKDRIKKVFVAEVRDNGRIYCKCGKDIGIDKGGFYKMIAKAFTYKGTKRRN